MSHLTNPVIPVALVILALVLSNAGAAFAGEPVEDPPGQEPKAPAEPDSPAEPDAPAVPDPPDTGAEMVDPKKRWSQMLENLGEHENRVHLDNVSGLEECFVELPLTETMAMLARPERTARVARFIFTFKPWRSEIKPAPEISPEVLIAIADAYEKKKNAKFAGYIKAVAKILYPQSPAVRRISGYVEHGGGWVLKDKLPKDLPPDLTPETEERIEKIRKMFISGRKTPLGALQEISRTIKHPKIEMVQGEILLLNRKWAAAAYCYRKALEYDSAWMEAYEKLAWALHKHAMENVPSATSLKNINEAFEKVRVTDPGWLKAHNNLGKELYKTIIADTDNSAALADIKKRVVAVRESDPSWMESQNKLGALLYEYLLSKIKYNGILSELDNVVITAQEFDPLGGRYILPAAENAYRRRELRRANALFRRACELDSSLGLAWLRRAQIREEAGMTDDALELVEDGIEACPNDEKLIFEKARMLAESNADDEELEKACAAYLEAFPLGPHAKEVRKFLEDLKSRQDEEKKKSEEPEKPENKEPEKPEKKEEQPEEKPDNGRLKIKAIDKQKSGKSGK